ncbi:Flagellar basal-body rod modification protein FlgD [Helicobacter heilmannii]|uniref:flagellar hook assembly protein FlgD n=1 Tax=Helicobacter heilmannii TaxID=35817 RepID=UPI0006A17C09|nr:flagellar hook assembly protein FlgD [Helicobacter heilmannii]CRF51153.1 Flagellar basal-body rod modification protein FlgD [Helicobacter heilmannii]
MPIDLAEVTGQKAAMEKKKHESKIANGLDKDAFMKLFLEQLKNQDPTAPMETDKIISQTAQLSQVEMQEENQKAMKEVADAMQSTRDTNKSLKDFQGKLKETLDHLDQGVDNTLKSNLAMTQASGLNSVSMIGKIAETDVKGINVTKGKVEFSLYFDEPIKNSEGNTGVQIFDKNKQLVRTLSLKSKEGQGGYVRFEWDGLNDQGKPVVPGTYEVFAEYNLDPKSNKYLHTRIGRGEVQSVVFEKGKPMLRMGEMVLPMDSALEFYDKNTTRREKEQRENAVHFVPEKAAPKPTAPTQAAKPTNLNLPGLAKTATASQTQSSHSPQLNTQNLKHSPLNAPHAAQNATQNHGLNQAHSPLNTQSHPTMPQATAQTHSPNTAHAPNGFHSPHTAQNSGLNHPLSSMPHSTNNSPLNVPATHTQGPRPSLASTTNAASIAPHTHRPNPLEQASTHTNPTSKSFA